MEVTSVSSNMSVPVASSPRTSERPVAREMTMTSGMVSPMEASGIFPPMVVSMVQVGEETGQLPDMLTKVADVFEEEVDNSVAGLTSMLEPVMIVMLALVVGTIVVALFLPLITIIQDLTGGA